jgi:hypothetical protein
MRKMVLILAFIGLFACVFGQNRDNAEIVGVWKHEKGVLAYRFNADGTFTMSIGAEEVQRFIQSGQLPPNQNAEIKSSSNGTYSVTRDKIIMFVNGQTRQRLTGRLTPAPYGWEGRTTGGL